VTQQRSLPRLLEAVLANRFSSAVLLVVTFAAAVWGPVMIAGSHPIIASFLALLLHFITMVLFCCIYYGGGTRHAWHVGLLATVAVFFVSEWDEKITLVFLLAYIAIPWLASSLLMMKHGLSRSITFLSVCCCLLFLIFAALSDVQALLTQSIAPLFDAVRAQQAELGGKTTLQAVAEMENLTVLLMPAALMQAMLFMWLFSMLVGRWFALRYQFYSGDVSQLSSFRMDRSSIAVLSVLLMVVFLFSDYLYYIALSLLLFVAGLFSFQGVIVAREWLKKRNSDFAVGVMYVILLIQPMMLIPFVMIGLLDVHYDYRRTNSRKSGGE